MRSLTEAWQTGSSQKLFLSVAQSYSWTIFESVRIQVLEFKLAVIPVDIKRLLRENTNCTWFLIITKVFQLFDCQQKFLQ